MTRATVGVGDQATGFGWQNTRKLKTDDELQIVYSEVYVPGFPDSQGDFMTSTEVRKMAHRFLSELPDNVIDVNHDGRSYKAEVVESFIARKGDSDFIEGAWVVGIHVEDAALWSRVKKGELNGLSMEALVTSVPVDLDMKIPEIVRCNTMKSDGSDHQHEVMLQLDDKGSIVGGETNYVNGHRHLIKRGTITEPAGSPMHKHRYDFLSALNLAA